MIDKCWLIATATGIKKMRKASDMPWTTPVQLAPGEYAVLVEVHVPDAAFKPRPLPGVKIEISHEALLAPQQTVSDRPGPPPAVPQKTRKR